MYRKNFFEDETCTATNEPNYMFYQWSLANLENLKGYPCKFDLMSQQHILNMSNLIDDAFIDLLK